MPDRCFWPDCAPIDGPLPSRPLPWQQRCCGCTGPPVPVCEPEWQPIRITTLPDIDQYEETNA